MNNFKILHRICFKMQKKLKISWDLQKNKNFWNLKKAKNFVILCLVQNFAEITKKLTICGLIAKSLEKNENSVGIFF